MSVTELIEKHAIDLNGGYVGGQSFKHIQSGYKQFAIELLERVKESARNDDLEPTIDKALEELRK